MAFTVDYHVECQAQWHIVCKEKKIPCSEDFTLTNTQSSQVASGHGKLRDCQWTRSPQTMALLCLTPVGINPLLLAWKGATKTLLL